MILAYLFCCSIHFFFFSYKLACLQNTVPKVTVTTTTITLTPVTLIRANYLTYPSTS